MKTNIFLTMIFVCSHANAEVMDKEPTLGMVISTAVIISVLGFISARYRPVFLVAIIPVFLFLAYGHLSELYDPFIGPAIVEEAGVSYVYISWTSIISVIISTVIGFFLRLKKFRYFRITS